MNYKRLHQLLSKKKKTISTNRNENGCFNMPSSKTKDNLLSAYSKEHSREKAKRHSIIPITGCSSNYSNWSILTGSAAALLIGLMLWNSPKALYDSSQNAGTPAVLSDSSKYLYTDSSSTNLLDTSLTHP